MFFFLTTVFCQTIPTIAILNCQTFLITYQICISFKGCDTTSSFHGKGKVTVFKTLKQNDKFLDVFCQIGESIPPSNEVSKQLQAFVCALYGNNRQTSVNKLRYDLFKSGKSSEECLPPNEDALKLHISRCNYQAYIWRHALDQNIDAPSFLEHGWDEDKDGNVKIKWLSGPPAPESLLVFVNCGCKTGCKSNRCSCHKATLPCTDLCKCESCENKSKKDDEESENDYDTDMDDSDTDFL